MSPLHPDYFASYSIPQGMLDEVFASALDARPAYDIVLRHFAQFGSQDIAHLNAYAKSAFFNQGITFNVYSDTERGVERIFPFDLFPRIIPKTEWDHLQAGILQRNAAINLFLGDIYNEKRILKDGVVPAELIFSSKNYCKHMEGFRPVGGIYTHIAGTDLIKHNDGQYYVLEDNVRCPSGVSYILSNRDTMKKTLPQLFLKYPVSSVNSYPSHLLEMMQSVAPEGIDEPTCVVLSPGMFNSAYYEHTFLAQSMGIDLVEGRDLFVDKNFVYMKTLQGPKRVDVIYRRVDDEFLDPLVFKPESVLGVPGIMAAYREGNVTLINAPGTGVADDKAVYTYVPDIIRYYLGQEPILNNVYTYRCEKEEDYAYVMDHMEQLVIKPVDESGGYGILIGNRSTPEERDEFRRVITANRRKYIAQPIMSLSMHATYIEETQAFEPRHVDLRTYLLMGKDYTSLLKGALSRVALRRGSLIVNSSQGGGSKDTWVLEE